MRHERMNKLAQEEGSLDHTTSELDADNDDSLPLADDNWQKERSSKEKKN